MAWLIAILVGLLVAAVLVRWRYGNPSRALGRFIERLSGADRATLIKVIAAVTLVFWALIWLTVDAEQRGGMEALFEKSLGGLLGLAPND